MVRNSSLDFRGEPTVKLAVELFAGLYGDVVFFSASSVPLIPMIGVCETLAAGRAAPVVRTAPE